MYKITVDGQTMVGCNEDAWRTTSKIWFENAKMPNEYGAGFTGSRQVGNGITAPQSGMNNAGLVFSRLVAYHPQEDNVFKHRKKIRNEVDYLTDILHKCATIDEVKVYIEQYDHSIFIDDVYIYIDSTGRYLVVEPYKLIEGNDANYVLSNFCPSITPNENARKQERYRNGRDFLKKHDVNASLSFCRTLSDTMHVCRNRGGDGTLLTSIWNTKEKLIHLYFYHAYDTTVEFSLPHELAKGDHILDIPKLFPKNEEFERLKSYKTPFNTPLLRVLLVILGGILTSSILLLALALIQKKYRKVLAKVFILMAGFNLLLTSYSFVLATNIEIFYFDVPYQAYNSNIISILSYTPFLLLFAIIPYTFFIFKQIKIVTIKPWIKMLLLSNHLIYFLLIVAFGYWGLFNIWN